MSDETDNIATYLEMTVDIVSAYVSNNPVPAGNLPGLIAEVHAALGRISSLSEEPLIEEQKPAVNPKHSVHDDYIICLEDGERFKSLRLHLMARYGLTPEQYRKKWGLGSSYPMVAPSYSADRSNLAKRIGLGRRLRAAPSLAPTKRTRQPKVKK